MAKKLATRPLRVKGQQYSLFKAVVSCCMTLHHPTQAYGDAVTDQAPLLLVSNWNTTLLFSRSLVDVEDKSLQVAEWTWDSADVPPLGAFLYVLHLAHSLWHSNAKQLLPREQVPTTPPSGYALQLGAQQMQLVRCTGLRQAAARRQPPRTAQHSTAQLPATLQVSEAAEDVCSDTSSLLLPNYSTGCSLLSSSDDRSSGGGTGAFDALAWADLAMHRGFSSTAEAVEALPCLPPGTVSSACLSSSSNRRVFTVSVPLVRGHRAWHQDIQSQHNNKIRLLQHR